MYLNIITREKVTNGSLHMHDRESLGAQQNIKTFKQHPDGLSWIETSFFCENVVRFCCGRRRTLHEIAKSYLLRD